MGISLCSRANEVRVAAFADKSVRATRTGLRAAAVVDVEFESWIRGEDFGDFAQAFGHGSGGQQGVVALAQIVVIDVEIEREQVDGNRIGEAGG